MTCVKCSVDNCSYNKDGGCYIDKVNIGGQGATQEEGTCCGSFLNEHHYSNIAEYTSNRSEASEVECNVNSCAHNSDCRCQLSEINVCGCNEVGNYTETNCGSFENCDCGGNCSCGDGGDGCGCGEH